MTLVRPHWIVSWSFQGIIKSPTQLNEQDFEIHIRFCKTITLSSYLIFAIVNTNSTELHNMLTINVLCIPNHTFNLSMFIIDVPRTII